VYTERGSIHAGKWNELSVREENSPARAVKPGEMPKGLENEWTYLRKVVRGECAVDPLSSFTFNEIVAEILDSAREQAGR